MTEETVGSPPTGVVFDCNVFIQALLNVKGPAYACNELIKNGNATLFLSLEIVAELRDVLHRPTFRRKFSHLTDSRIDAFLKDLLSYATLQINVPKIFTLERDPKDEMYINLALSTGATYVVSRDNDLLDLMDKQKPGGKEFIAQFPSLTILDPVAFLRALQETLHLISIPDMRESIREGMETPLEECEETPGQDS